MHAFVPLTEKESRDLSNLLFFAFDWQWKRRCACHGRMEKLVASNANFSSRKQLNQFVAEARKFFSLLLEPRAWSYASLFFAVEILKKVKVIRSPVIVAETKNCAVN